VSPVCVAEFGPSSCGGRVYEAGHARCAAALRPMQGLPQVIAALSATLERVDKIGAEVSHIENIARRERHSMDFGGRREQGIHG
jgi:hypothetical protein